MRPSFLAMLLLAVAGCSGRPDVVTDSGTDARASIDATSSDGDAPADAPVASDAPIATDAPVATDAPIAADATPTSDAACAPVTNDASAIGNTCTGAGDCPSGYTCQGFSGIIFAQSCQILCERDCDCPTDHTCSEVSDKSGIPWHQCTPS